MSKSDLRLFNLNFGTSVSFLSMSNLARNVLFLFILLHGRDVILLLINVLTILTAVHIPLKSTLLVTN